MNTPSTTTDTTAGVDCRATSPRVYYRVWRTVPVTTIYHVEADSPEAAIAAWYDDPSSHAEYMVIEDFDSEVVETREACAYVDRSYEEVNYEIIRYLDGAL